MKTRDTGPGIAVARLARHLAHALDGTDLSMAQYRVLSFLDDNEAAASGIAGRLRVSKPSMTALIDGMAEHGLVERKPDPNDRRRHPLHITKAGRKALREADRAAEERLAHIAAHLDDPAGGLAALTEWNSALTAYHLDRTDGPDSAEGKGQTNGKGTA